MTVGIRSGLVLVLAVALTASVLAQRGRGRGGPPPAAAEEIERSPQEQQDIDTALDVVDAVVDGTQPAPTDIPIVWESNHFFRSADGNVYSPYTLAIDASSLAAPGVALYVRVVSKEAAPAEAAPEAAPDAADQPEPDPFPWERIYFIDIEGADANVSRPMQLSPGQYEVIVLVKEGTPEEQAADAPPLEVGVLRHDLTVPDYAQPGLSVSSVLVTTAIEPAPADFTAEEQDQDPYVALGGVRLVPAPGSQASKSGAMQVFFFIYGAGDRNGTPDVQVGFNFYTQVADGEKYFNKMAPLELNAQTLPPGFDLNAGNQLFSIVDIPLASFPAGDYRVEITVADKIDGGMLTDNANFSLLAD